MVWLLMVFSYLLGSIPTAYIAGRFFHGKDIRLLGDGNVGARNAFHHLGHGTGIAIFFIDAAKGFLVIYIARMADLPQAAVLIAGAVSVVGHNWPVFLRFRGGRGESTTIGVLIAVITQPMLIVAGPVLIALALKKNIYIISVLLFVPLPFICWWLDVPGILTGYSIGLPCLVGITHFIRVRQIAVHKTEKIVKHS